MRKSSNIEILLMLCCLIGVVAFLSFAMGALNLVEGVANKEKEVSFPLLEEEQARLNNEKELKEKKIEELEREKNELKARLDRIEQTLPDVKREQEDRKELEKKLEKLQSEHKKLMLLIIKKEEEIQAVKRLNRENDEMRDREAELTKELGLLREKEKELRSRITAKKNLLAKMIIPLDSSLEKDIEELNKRIDEAERKKKELEEEIARIMEGKSTFNPWKDFEGTVSLLNPLFVECRDNAVTLHPEKRVISLSSMKRNNPFLKMSDEYDGIVFLVRPGGFSSFSESLKMAEKTELPRAYEPIDDEWTLDFSKNGREK